MIDDERSVCVSCTRILEEEGYAVDQALSGREGLRMASTGDYDLALIDLKMPDIGGMEILQALHRDRPDVITVMITGYATIHTGVEAVKKGASDYLPKPFTPEELSTVVSRALAERAALARGGPLEDGRIPVGALLGSEPVPETVEALKEVKRRVREAVYEQVERAFVRQALERTAGNVTRASGNVGMQRPNFHALMRKHNIRRQGGGRS
ncbi:MAG: response regulator [Deltaproteobacteria bacterium]|nr:response regulator [Deltaproteobacteria bacterium]